MDQDPVNNRETTQELKRKKRTIKTDQDPQDQHLQKKQNSRRFKRTITHNITNLGKYQLTTGEISLLSKGLTFIPTLHKEHPAKPLHDILLYDRKLRLKYYFHQDTPNESTESTEQTEEEDTIHNNILHPSSEWTHPQDKTLS